MKRGFTMVELIFALVIIAIISTIGADIIRNIYISYVYSKEVERSQNDLRRTLDIIGARLTHRIKNSTVGMSGSADKVLGVNDPTLQGGTHTTLAWVAKAYESQRSTGSNSGWSGFLTITDWNSTSGVRNASTQDSNFSHVVSVENSDFFGFNNVRLVFAGNDGRGDMPWEYGKSWGWVDGDSTITPMDKNNSSYYNITRIDDENITVTPMNPWNHAPVPGSGEYYLARSAYALNVNNNKELVLYYNFRPWLGEKINDANTKSVTLLENVDSFQFIEMGGILRVTLCVTPPEDFPKEIMEDAEFCRERSIF